MDAPSTIKLNRALAFIYAVGLAVGEAILNWGNWQYAPLWIVDYMIAGWLVVGASTRNECRATVILATAWAFSIGVMYMALAVTTSPENTVAVPELILWLIGVLIAASITGLFFSYRTLTFHLGNRDL